MADAASADENSEEKATQSYAALSIGVICLLIGLPVWWKTTEVYRVQLPYSSIAALEDITVTYTVHFDVVTFAHDDRLSELETKLKFHEAAASLHSHLHGRYIGQLLYSSAEERQLLDSSATLEEFEKEIVHLKGEQKHGNYTIYILPSDSRLLLTAGVAFIGRNRAAFVPLTEDVGDLVQQILRVVLVKEEAIYKAIQTANGSATMQADKESMRALRSTPGYDVTFTLLNPQPDVLRVKWDIAAAISKYLQALISAFSEYANISIKSQYLHYTGLGVQAEKSNVGSQLKQEQLPHIINPIEAYLGSHVSNNPNLNFIVYIPTRQQSPLKILDASGVESSTNAFLSPRWGGLLVYNADVTPNENTSLPVNVDVDMHRVMSVFAVQLRLLLGIHPTMSDRHIEVQSPGSKVIADWELDQWLRERTVENIFTSAATLGSLAELLGKIGNIVINDDIGAQVVRGVESIQLSSELLAVGQLRDAFLVSRLARDASEKAFFDPSLLELLYFPEDQKFAIYIPLFLPVGFPIVLSLVQAIKWLRTVWKGKTKTD